MREKPRIAAIGMFDGVHCGHREILQCMRHYALEHDMETVVFSFVGHPLSVINPDAAPRLISTPQQKSDLIKGCGIDEVELLSFTDEMRHLTAREFMLLLRDKYGVRALMLGFNHRFGSDRLQRYEDYAAIGAELGIDVKRVEYLVELSCGLVSSSQIRRFIAEGNMDDAAQMLGGNFVLQATVAHGLGIGHTIGFPTANAVPLMPEQIIPRNGVYAAEVFLPETQETYPAMVNIGTRPTITGGKARPTIEAHLIGYDGDLYGKRIDLAFGSRIRDERKFSSVEALTEQLRTDKAQILKNHNKLQYGKSTQLA